LPLAVQGRGQPGVEVGQLCLSAHHVDVARGGALTPRTTELETRLPERGTLGENH
jgi:hypothetical protein